MKKLNEKYLKALFPVTIVFFTSNLVYAATFSSVAGKVIDYFNQIIKLLVGLGVFFMVYGIFRYVGAGDDEKKMAEARSLLLWGIIALFVMVSFWGILNMLLVSFFDSSTLQSQSISSELYPH